MDKTIFERIIDREIPATIVFEDHEIIAIRDIAPIAPIHVLIITKRPIPSIDELTPDDAALVGRVFIVARDLAKKFEIAEGGYRVVTNCNSDAGQTVSHLHFHLLGGAPLGAMTSTLTKKNGGSVFSGVMHEAAILLLCAVGLAFGFNATNSKSISWIKKEYEKVIATTSDVDKYLIAPSASSADTITTIQPTPAVKPTSDVVEKAPVKPVIEKTEQPTFVAEPGVVREISYDQFVRLMASAPYYLIDARGAEKYAESHIGNASNFYGADVESRIPDLLREVPRDKVVLIYCDGGECELSHHVADVLKQFSYGPIFIFTGGWAEWKKNH